jgi:glutaredoxin
MPLVRTVLIVLTLAVVAGLSRASAAEPTVYAFWATSCPFSNKLMRFLEAQRAKDPALVVRTFEVEQDAANDQTLQRLHDRIGITGATFVPLVVVGRNVVVGYVDDATTGAEILSHVAACRKATCDDAVYDLVEPSAAEVARLDRRECVAERPTKAAFAR